MLITGLVLEAGAWRLGLVGSFRFFLAILVVVSHLVGMAGGVGAIAHVGYFAVFGFYLLSGYYISKVLRETYSFRFLPFLTNRVLRLYPQYYVVAALTVLVVTFVQKPIIFQLIKQDWTLSTDALALVANLLIFPFPFVLPGDSYILVPQVWSIGIEILCYGLLWLVIARRPTNALAVGGAAIIYDALTFAFGWNWGVRYYLLPAALLPFSIGSFLSWQAEWRQSLSDAVLKRDAAIAFALWSCNLVATGYLAPIGSRAFDQFFFLNLGLSALLIFFLVDPRLRIVPVSIDRLLGKLSYPVFLTHWIIAFVVRRAFVTGIPFGKLGWTLFLVSLPFILLTSYALVVFQDKAFDPIRTRIRSQHDILKARFFSKVGRAA